VPGGRRDGLEPELEYLDGLDRADRPMALARVAADPDIELIDLGIRKA
jgi:hypothetical protein